MIVDLHDFAEGNSRLDLLCALHDANPLFKATMFAVPGQCSPAFLDRVPPFLEIAVHGWMHPHPRECENWTADKMRQLMAEPIVHEYFVPGFCAPGWQISDGCYQALAEAGWWVSDHYENDARRPVGLRTHRLSETAASGRDPEHWHGHIQNVCGNGLAETWDALYARVKAVTAEEGFTLVSEAARPWTPNGGSTEAQEIAA